MAMMLEIDRQRKAHESVFVAAHFHAMTNMAWGLVSNYGSFYDPRIVFIFLALTACIVVLFWGPSTLASFGQARRRLS